MSNNNYKALMNTAENVNRLHYFINAFDFSGIKVTFSQKSVFLVGFKSQ